MNRTLFYLTLLGLVALFIIAQCIRSDMVGYKAQFEANEQVIRANFRAIEAFNVIIASNNAVIASNNLRINALFNK